MTKLTFFGDNDTTSDAEAVNAAMLKENADQYVFVGDGPYAKTGTKWVEMMKKSFPTTDKLMMSQGNHDNNESESDQTEKDIEAWIPSLGTTKWLEGKQVGNSYIISMNTQDMDVEFPRDQFNWVTAELVKAKALRAAGTIDWIIVLFHKPFFTEKSSHSPYTAVRFQYKEIFRDAQVDFCVSGHNHNTQLWKPMIPNDSQANGEGEELFTKLPDGTFDFTKDHGAFFIVSGHAGHEWNPIKEQNPHVMYHKDSGKFGYTLIETNGKKATVFAKDTDNATTFEYKVTREGGVVVEPPPVEDCSDPAKCIDPVTKECRPIGINEHKSPTNGTCMPNTVEPPKCPPDQYWDEVQQKCVPFTQPPPAVVCPRSYHWDTSLNKCIPDLEPKINPVCPDDYHWDSTKWVCVLDAPQPGEPFAKLTAPNQVTGGMNVVLDGSQSVGDTITITQTAGQTTSLTDVVGEINKKQFTAPTTGHHSLGFQLTAAKGTKMAISQVVITVTNIVTPPPPCLQGECKDVTTQQCRPIGPNEEKDVNGFCKPKVVEPPPTGGEIDQHGIKWFTKGEQTTIEQTRDEADDDRWSGNVTGLENGFEATMIAKGTGVASDGHFAMKQFGGNHSGGGASSQRWYDTGLRSDGEVQLQWEGPHPSNHDFTLPDTKWFIKKISKGLEGSWIGLKWRCEKVKPGGSPADGGVHVRMWVDEDPLDASNKPKNNWQLVFDFIDGVDEQVISPQDYKAPDEQDCEVRRSGTESHEIIGGGLHVRKLSGDVIVSPPPQPTECPQGQHWDSGLGKCVDDIIVVPPPVDPICPPGQHLENHICVPDTITPPPPPPTSLKYKFSYKFGSKGKGDGQFLDPHDVSFDRENNVFVPDRERNDVQVFTHDGKFLRKFGGPGTGPGQFNVPYSTAHDTDNNFYVTDRENNRLQKFTNDGVFITELKSINGKNFVMPEDISFDPINGDIYMCDTGNNRIIKMDKNFQFILEWGSKGTGDGQFDHPHAIDVDRNRNVYISCGFLPFIQKFTPEGKFIKKWGKEGTGDGEMIMFLEHMDIDVFDRLHLINNNIRPVVQVWDLEGKYLTKYGSEKEGSADGELAEPEHVTVDSIGRPFIVDSGNFRVQVFAPAEGTTPPPPPPPTDPICPPGQHLENHICVPDVIIPPPPTGDVLWDSNIHLKTGQAFKVTGTYGSQEPDGKGVFMAASGSPRLIVDADGTFHLEADAGHGRVYIKAKNYNAMMEGELMFEDDVIRNTTLRLRSRHGEGGACENRFGGFGVTVEKAEQLAETSTERCHNEHSNTIKKPLVKKLEKGKWIKFKYSCWSNADKSAINQKLEYDYNDGQGFATVIEESFTTVEPHMMDEASFQEESYAWLRVNNESTGKVAYRNIRIIKI